MAKIAFLLASGYDATQFRTTYDKARELGHDAIVLGNEAGKLVMSSDNEDLAEVEQFAALFHSGDFDAVVIPGGTSPSKVRAEKDTVDFLRQMTESGKVVAALSRGASVLAEAGVLDGREVTSHPETRAELEAAGARWREATVVEDSTLITTSSPEAVKEACPRIFEQVEALGSV